MTYSIMNSPEERFWSKVNKTDGCWLWTNSRKGKGTGYGHFYPPNAKRAYAHRYSYELANGPIPPGMNVLHRCDVVRCVNPDHLFLGTQADNVADMINKGRQSPSVEHGRPGERNGRAKLTNSQAEEIRREYAKGKTSLEKLGTPFGLSKSSVARIVNFQTYQ